MMDLEQQLTDHLRQQAAAVIPRHDLEAVEQGLGFVEFVHREDRPHRRPVIGVLAGAAAVAAALVGIAVVATQDDSTSGSQQSFTSFLGGWTSTDTDGSAQTMEIATTDDGSAQITIHDAAATAACAGVAATVAGTGELDSRGGLAVVISGLTCEDGSEPAVPADELSDVMFTYDRQSDTLTETSGVVWLRKGTDDPVLAPPGSGTMWPQSSVDEVRGVQELADAGDPAYTWQVDRQLSTGDWQEYLVHNPNSVEIVSRFLREELGWDSYLVFQGGDTAQSGDEFTLIDLVYLRCAPGETNPLYPIPTVGVRGAELCAPTIDELRYETVRLNLSQLARQGPDGIWVVSRWRITAPVTQADPNIVEAAATAHLEDFLRARIVGAGAEGYVRVVRGDQEVPLLYATTTGAPYERFEIELVSGPVWPDGWMEFTVRLYAEGGETVVEQRISGLPDELSHIPSETTENGELLAVPYVFLDGEVTVSATAPWALSRLHDALDRSLEHGAERVEFVRAPRPVVTGCAPGSVPTDAEALAASLQSDTDLLSTSPVRLNIGGLNGLEMDVTVAPGASICRENGYASTLALVHGEGGQQGSELPGVAADAGSRMRLYLLDMPEGSATPILAIAVVASEASFETVVEAAAPILESIEFHPGGS